MQAQRASLKRSASGAFARQQDVQGQGTRSSQSPTMGTLRTGKQMLVPHKPQSNGITSSPNMSNSHGYAARDQYQYPAQADRFRHMPPNAESTGSSNDYRDQETPYYGEQIPSSPAASEGRQYTPDSQMDMVKYHNNNTMSEYSPMPNYEMQAPPQSYPSQDDELDQQALRAKRDAEAKRKQIPPFVQKLSSFLNSEKDPAKENLIRWSNKGDSFVIIDEDEFARTLIPELFKHNNYASFVRQLNMYGFHKQVALSDGSMRAGERKNKSPSEYSNPYFQRDRPNLLWLIQKPKNTPAKGAGKGGTRAKQEDADEEVDDTFNRDSSIPPNYGPIENGTSMGNGRQPLMLGNSGNSLPPDQFAAIQQELADIRANQVKITKLLNMTQIRHDQLYHQAKAFHHMHEQHDNSINAILTFLATIYNKNLDQGTTMDMRNLFNGPPNKQGQGNVVEVGDENTQSASSGQNQQQRFRRQPLLLKDGSANPPAQLVDSPQHQNQSYGKATPETYEYPTRPRSYMNSPAIQELSDRGTSSNRSSQSPQIKPNQDTDQQMPEADIMSVINSHNANALSRNDSASTRMEFPEAFSHLQNANSQSPLTQRQREDMLNLMSNELANNPQNGTGNGSNSLTSYSPLGTSASPNIEQLELERNRINQIEQQLREQSVRMENLKGTVVPLSPTGSIPGVTDQHYNNPNQELGFDDIFNTTDYFNSDNNPNADFDWSNNNGGLPDYDFSIDAPSGENGADTGENMFSTDGAERGRVIEADSSEATSPANTADDGTAVGGDALGSPGKRRRIG